MTKIPNQSVSEQHATGSEERELTVMTNDPFFILANPRSGSSLLRLMLNSHPLITVPPECGFAVWLKSKYENRDLSLYEVRLSFLNDLYNSRKFETWRVPYETVSERVLQREYLKYSDLVLDIYRIYALEGKKDPMIYGDKNNFYVDYVAEIIELFPNAKFIHLVRDGRDVAASFFALDKKDIISKYSPPTGRNIDSLAEEWVANNKKISQNVTRHTIQISYENLVNHTSQTLKEICGFLNIPFSESMQSFFLSNDEPDEFLQWKERTTQPVDGTTVGRYKSDLTQSQVVHFNRIAKPLLNEYGYKS